MSIKDYISSGILESYALGQLSEVEVLEVEKMISEHAEIQSELEKIERSLESLAFSASIAPPAHLKKELLQSVSQDDTPVVSIKKENAPNPFLKYAAAASILIALISSILAFNYHRKWQSAESQLTDLIAQNQRFADNYNTVNQQLETIRDAFDILNDESFDRVVMKGTANSPESLATIYWNETSEEVYLSIQNLQELSQDQQYQLWAIVDGVPVDAGVFDIQDSDLLIQMKNISSNAAAFAVTIEPRGGSENPTLETMQVLGNV